MKEKKAFTLVEIIISTIILTWGVFAIYKLLSINTNNLNNYDNLSQANNMFINIQECIKSIWFNYFTGWIDYSFNFGNNNNNNNWCFTWNYDPTLNFSWVIIDNREYFLYWSWIWASEKINWQLFVKESSLSEQKKDFTLYK